MTLALANDPTATARRSIITGLTNGSPVLPAGTPFPNVDLSGLSGTRPPLPPSSGPSNLSPLNAPALAGVAAAGKPPTPPPDLSGLHLDGLDSGPASVPGLQTSGYPDSEGPGGITGNLPPANPTGPPQSADDVYHHDYSSGSNVNNSGKNKFGRFKAALGHDPSDDEIRQFVAANPNEWEDSTSPGGEYVFRQRQGFLNDSSNMDSKTGANTIWQNRHFVNAAGSGDGYAPPYQESQAGQTGAGPFGSLDPMIAGNPMGNIQDALAAVQRPGTIQDIIKRLQQGT